MPFDPDELVQLVDQHGSALRALAGQWSDSPEDLVQEAFCRLAAQRARPRHPAAWLFQVVRNLAFEAHRRGERRRRRETMVATAESMHVDPSKAAEARAAAELLDQLEPELREVVVMRLWAGLTLEEIAEACGVSVATVHRRYEAALKELRQRWKSPCPHPI